MINHTHRPLIITAALIASCLVSCAEPNDPVSSVLLTQGETYTRIGTSEGESLRLQFDADAGWIVRFRAWSVGVLAGVEVTIKDSDEEVIYQNTGLGTELRVDGFRAVTSGRYTATVRWLEGSGVAGYRYDVVGLSSDRLQIQSRESLTTPLAGHRAVRLPDGRLLATGGHAVGSGLSSGQLTPVANTTLINPETGKSSPGQQMLDARAYHAIAVFPGGPYQGQVLIAGGLGAAGDALFTTEIYNPDTGDFTRGPDLPEPRAYLDALPIRVPVDSEPLFLDNNIVLAFGERTRRGPQHSFADGLYSEIDENRREIWRTDGEVVQRISNGDSAALLETGRLFGQMVFQPSSRAIMFIGGGIDTIPTAPGCRQAPNNVCHCTSVDIPLCTEFSDCQNGQCDTIRSYNRKDLATDTVEVHRDGQRFTLPPSSRLNRARAAFGIAQLPGDRVLVAGGVSAVRRNFWANEAGLVESPDTIDSVELWTPSDPASGVDGTWRVLLPLSIPREHFSLAVLEDGGVYAIGGMTPIPGGHRGVDLIERYDDDVLRFIPVGNLGSGQAASQVITTENAREIWLLGGEAGSVPSNSIETVTLLSE